MIQRGHTYPGKLKTKVVPDTRSRRTIYLADNNQQHTAMGLIVGSVGVIPKALKPSLHSGEEHADFSQSRTNHHLLIGRRTYLPLIVASQVWSGLNLAAARCR